MESSRASPTVVNQAERAPRFSLNLAMRYRIDGQENWESGKVVNMSSTGVLFSGQFVVKRGSRIDVSIDLPFRRYSTPHVRIIAKGVVVRSSETDPPGSGVLVAAQLASPRLLRR